MTRSGFPGAIEETLDAAVGDLGKVRQGKGAFRE